MHSSTTRIVQQLGGALGAAVLAVVLQHQLDTAEQATAFGHTFLWVAAFAAFAIIPALLLPRLRHHHEALHDPAIDDETTSVR